MLPARNRKRREWLARLGTHIRRLRLERDLSQEEVAHRAGLAPPHVSMIERGRLNFGVYTAVLLAEALSCSLNDLLAYQPAEERAPLGPMRPWQRRVSVTTMPMPARIETRARVAFHFSRLRRKAGITQEALGEALGHGAGLIEGIEDCSRPVTSEVLYGAARALHVSPAQFFRAIPVSHRPRIMALMKKALQDAVLHQAKVTVRGTRKSGGVRKKETSGKGKKSTNSTAPRRHA